MFNKKKDVRRPPRTTGGLSQYGLFDVADNLDDIGNDLIGDGNDEDFEAELAALTAGDEPHLKRKRNNPRKPIPDADLDAMVAASMKDVNLDEEVSGGEDDPELLDELKMITGDESVEDASPVMEQEPLSNDSNDTSSTEMIKLLEERLKMYETAENKAKKENESARARRYNRGIKTLKELLSSAHAGKPVDNDAIPPIPPPSALTESTSQPTDNEASVPTENVVAQSDNGPEPAPDAVIDQEALESLKKRQQEYKIAAVAWKRVGNMQEAMQHVKIAKQFDVVIAAMSAGESIDLSDMPPSPSLPSINAASPDTPQKEENETQQGAPTEAPPESQTYHGPEDIGSALKERLEVYRRTKTAAESEGNAAKARRYGRICKQFEDALKLHARGKPVPLEELPVPPGFPPLIIEQPQASNEKEPQPAANLQPSPTEDSENSSPRKSPHTQPRTKPTTGAKQNQRITSRAEKQLQQLQQRQHQLRQAAYNAKQDGDVELARDYLRQAKGLQPLIEASKGGLPVDMNSIPLSPVAKMELEAHYLAGQTDDNFTLISNNDCIEETTGGSDEQIYENLESQLVKQIKWCLSTRDHSKALGDVPGYNRWERLALSYTRDLDMLRVRKRDNLPPPQHHYETKTYAIVQSCTDLNDGDVEISIIRGVNYPREADTYVMFEFPYPSDSPPSDRTSTVKGTNNPEYQAVFPLTGILERNSRQCQRAFKRHALKCQIWAKGCSLNPILCCTHPRGFFRSDSLLGTVTVKLQPLETQCILHDSFPLMEGRKATGGKLELKIRLRNPISTKQIEQITDKWLTIDQ